VRLAAPGLRRVRAAMRPGRLVSSKNASQASRSAEAPFRQCPSEHPVAQLIPARLPDNPSRSRHREPRAEDAFFRP
jgi:hypothetical protein